MRICPGCGAKNKPTKKFCRNCGRPIQDVQDDGAGEE